MSEGTPPPDSSSSDDSGQTRPPPPPPSPPGSGGQQPGWGSPPTAGQGGGYPPPPPPPGPGVGGSDAYSPTGAVAYGWNKFKANPAPLLLGTLVLLVVSGLISYVTNLVAAGLFTTETARISSGGTIELDSGSGLLTRLLVSMVVSLIVGLVSQVIVAGLIKGALDTTDGKPVSVGGMFDGWDKGKVLVAALIVSVATAIGTLLCYLPGLVIGFLTSYTLFFVVDRNLEPVEAIKASFTFVTANLGPTLVYYLLGILVVVAGAILCGVGLLAAVPIAVVGAAYTFRRLQGQQVTPA